MINNSYYSKVIEFNKLIKCNSYIDDLKDDKLELLIKSKKDLINEEFDELKEAFNNDDIIEFIDALIDILYVIYGIFISYNITPKFLNFDDYFYSDNIKKKFNLEYNLLDFNKNLNEKLLIKKINNNSIFDLILLEELIKNFNIYNKNKNDVYLYLNNSIMTIFNIFIELNLNPDIFFNEVHNSNMTKFCKTKEDLEQSLKYYNDNNIKCYYDYNNDNNVFIIYKEENNKCLKPLSYKKPNIKNILYNLFN